MTAALPRVAYTCIYCGSQFTRTIRDTRDFCHDSDCLNKQRTKARVALAARGAWDKKPKPCRICGKTYTPKTPNQVTCGADNCKRANERLCMKRLYAELHDLPAPEIVEFAPPRPVRPKMIKCIRTNEFYLAGHEYDRDVVKADLKKLSTPEYKGVKLSHYDFQWEKVA